MNKEDLPLVMTAQDIMEILSVSRATAYNLMDEEDFPTSWFGQRCKRVVKDDFIEWLENQKYAG